VAKKFSKKFIPKNKTGDLIMNFLVTGGTGFMGSYVVRDLVKIGHRVVCFQRSGATPILQELIPDKLLKSIKIVQGKITDFGLFSEAVKENRIEIIIHFAGVMVPDSEENIPLAVQTNIVGLSNVFEAARINKVRRVVWSSSNTVLGKLGTLLGENPIDVSTGIYCPTNFYGATKALGELMAKQYIEKQDMDIISLRFPRVFGIGKASGGGVAFTELMKNVALGNPVTIKGGDSSWAYIYVEDAASLTIKACEAHNTKTKIFNLHEGGNYTGWDLANILKEINPGLIVTVEPGKAQYNFPTVDISALKTELDFTPRYTFKEGIKLAANYFRKQNNLPQF
jgi:UDP-glucose 4-epimerase